MLSLIRPPATSFRGHGHDRKNFSFGGAVDDSYQSSGLGGPASSDDDVRRGALSRHGGMGTDLLGRMRAAKAAAKRMRRGQHERTADAASGWGVAEGAGGHSERQGQGQQQQQQQQQQQREPLVLRPHSPPSGHNAKWKPARTGWHFDQRKNARALPRSDMVQLGTFGSAGALRSGQRKENKVRLGFNFESAQLQRARCAGVPSQRGRRGASARAKLDEREFVDLYGERPQTAPSYLTDHLAAHGAGGGGGDGLDDGFDGTGGYDDAQAAAATSVGWRRRKAAEDIAARRRGVARAQERERRAGWSARPLHTLPGMARTMEAAERLRTPSTAFGDLVPAPHPLLDGDDEQGEGAVAGGAGKREGGAEGEEVQEDDEEAEEEEEEEEPEEQEEQEVPVPMNGTKGELCFDAMADGVFPRARGGTGCGQQRNGLHLAAAAADPRAVKVGTMLEHVMVTQGFSFGLEPIPRPPPGFEGEESSLAQASSVCSSKLAPPGAPLSSPGILLRNPLRPATAPAAASSSRVGVGGTTASKQRAIRGADRACVGLSSAPPHEPYSGTPNLMLRRTRYRTMARTRQNKLPLAGLRGGTRNSLLRH
jgi:hypothetical protein